MNDGVFHFVVYLAHGSPSRSEEHMMVAPNPYSLELPDNFYGFRFFEMVKFHHRTGREKFNYSGVYYPQGRLMSIEDVIPEEGEDSPLVKTMRQSGWKRVVRTRHNWNVHFHYSDKII